MLDRYLFKRKNSRQWQLRVPVPKDVVAAFGTDQFTRSMRETDRAKAAAKALPIIHDSKTAAGVRQVPVHPALSWLLKRKRGSADNRVWAMFNPEGPGKKPGADASREFSRFKAQRGFSKDRQKTFHSFRKNVTRIMERAGVPENEWAQVFGHERGFTYRVYNPDGISLERKSEIIAMIDYPGLSLPMPQ